MPWTISLHVEMHGVRRRGAEVTQYYEPEANALERRACESNDPGEQNRLWAEASRIGTPMEYCTNGCYCELPYPGAPEECDIEC
jgi:hypothetical protein